MVTHLKVVEGLEIEVEYTKTMGPILRTVMGRIEDRFDEYGRIVKWSPGQVLMSTAE